MFGIYSCLALSGLLTETHDRQKSVDRRTPIFGSASNSKTAAIQDDIEIEVAEALFDLMKQSQSQFQSSQRQAKVDNDGKNTASDGA